MLKNQQSPVIIPVALIIAVSILPDAHVKRGNSAHTSTPKF